MAAEKRPAKPPRSPKAPRPPEEFHSSPRVRRRQKTAHATLRKDTTILQAADGPRARWPAAKPKFKKR